MGWKTTATHHWRITVNRNTGGTTVERRDPARGDRWVWMGVTLTKDDASERIADGWRDDDGPVFPGRHLIEVIR